MLAAWLLLIAVVARLPGCSCESGGAVTVAMNITGLASPCATDSNSAEKVRSHIAGRRAAPGSKRTTSQMSVTEQASLNMEANSGHHSQSQTTWSRVNSNVLLHSRRRSISRCRTELPEEARGSIRPHHGERATHHARVLLACSFRPPHRCVISVICTARPL